MLACCFKAVVHLACHICKRYGEGIAGTWRHEWPTADVQGLRQSMARWPASYLESGKAEWSSARKHLCNKQWTRPSLLLGEEWVGQCSNQQHHVMSCVALCHERQITDKREACKPSCLDPGGGGGGLRGPLLASTSAAKSNGLLLTGQEGLRSSLRPGSSAVRMGLADCLNKGGRPEGPSQQATGGPARMAFVFPSSCLSLSGSL